MYAKQVVSTETDEARVYIISRLHEIYSSKLKELQERFLDDPRPESPREAKEWLKAGNYRFDSPLKDEVYESGNEYEGRYYFQDYFRWGKESPDKKAFKLATEKLKKAYTMTEDTIRIKTDESIRLKALQDFESFSVN